MSVLSHFALVVPSLLLAALSIYFSGKATKLRIPPNGTMGNPRAANRLKRLVVMPLALLTVAAIGMWFVIGVMLGNDAYNGVAGIGGVVWLAGMLYALDTTIARNNAIYARSIR